MTMLSKMLPSAEFSSDENGHVDLHIHSRSHISSFLIGAGLFLLLGFLGVSASFVGALLAIVVAKRASKMEKLAQYF